MKISFDFDSTLSEPQFQELAKIFLAIDGIEVFVVTSRLRDAYPIHDNRDLFKVTDGLGIARDNVFFTEGRTKAQLLDKLEIDYHFDDMEDEIDLINNSIGCHGILVGFKLSNIGYLLNQ